jgi:AcrR family transcriptional regulator
MRKSNKEVLYRAAFKLFLSKQFDGVSLSDIEDESGLTRGAIFLLCEG